MRNAPVHIIFLIAGLFTWSCLPAQYIQYKPDTRADSLWVASLIKEWNGAKRLTDSTQSFAEWVYGKVIYSPDRMFKLAELKTAEGSYAGVLQVNFYGSLKRYFLSDIISVDHLPVTRIIKLNAADPAYLFISVPGDTATGRNDEAETLEPDEVKTCQVSGIRLLDNGIKPLIFEGRDGNATYYRFESVLPDKLKLNKAGDKLMIEWEASGRLVVNAFTEEIEEPDIFYHVDKKIFRFRDSVFKLLTDTSFYSPSLEKFHDTLEVKQLKLGPHKLRSVITTRIEEVGMGLVRIKYHRFHINKNVVESSVHLDGGDAGLEPVIKLQKDSSLIIMSVDGGTRNMPGACGGCWEESYTFHRITKNTVKELFTASFNVGMGRGSYDYKNEKGKYISGDFSMSDTKVAPENALSFTPAITWVNASTVRIRLTDEFRQIRDYLVHFSGTRVKLEIKPYPKSRANK